METIWSAFLQVLGALSRPFLSFGSESSLTSLTCALAVAVAFLAARRYRRRRRIRLKAIMRALFPRRIASHPSTLVDVSYLVFNLFIFGAILGWALLSYQVLGNGVREFKAIELEQAIHQLTQVPAELFGLRERGLLRTGWHADVVASPQSGAIARPRVLTEPP